MALWMLAGIRVDLVGTAVVAEPVVALFAWDAHPGCEQATSTLADTLMHR